MKFHLLAIVDEKELDSKENPLIRLSRHFCIQDGRILNAQVVKEGQDLIDQ